MGNLFGAMAGLAIIYIVGFFFCFGIFWLVLRPLVLWYFKINQIKEQQEKTNMYLSQILKELENKNVGRSSYSSSSSNSDYKPSESHTDHSAYMPK